MLKDVNKVFWNLIICLVLGGWGIASAQAPDIQEASSDEEISFDFRDPFQPFLPREEEIERVEIHPGGEPKDDSYLQEEDFDYSSLKITGLVWGAQDPKAIINDRVLSIGDVINEGEIIDISKGGILFKYKNREFLMKRSNVESQD